MALSSWLASLKADVSNVSAVQDPIHAGLGRYVNETADVSGVSRWGGMATSDTVDTAGNMQTYQAQPAWVLACTGDTADTSKEIDTDIQTTDAAATPTQCGTKRVFRQRGRWLTGTEQSAAQDYHAHHFNCHTCIAAGRGIGYGKRCAFGLVLWNTYRGVDRNNRVNQLPSWSMG
jgi:hypothetical protein